MDRNFYSQLKSAWHPDRINDFRVGKRPSPIHVHFVLSDLCNQDCGFCAYRSSIGLSTELFAEGELAKIGTNNPKRQIPKAKALELVQEFAAVGVKAVQFTGGGEPTAHPDHLAIMDLAQAYKMETSLVTNGLKMNPNCAVTHNHAWIRVSIDAGDAETYMKVRRVPKAHYEAVWSNVTTLAQQYKGVLGIGFVVTLENYTGLLAAARRAADSGASNMRVGAVFSKEGMAFYKGKIPEITSVINNVKALCDTQDFTVIDLFGRRLGDLEEGSPEDSFCHYQYLTLYVGGDLNLYRCCNTAYTLSGCVGSLWEHPLHELLLKYEPFDARQCRYCQFLGQNKTIAALVQKPTHVNFV